MCGYVNQLEVTTLIRENNGQFERLVNVRLDLKKCGSVWLVLYSLLRLNILGIFFSSMLPPEHVHFNFVALIILQMCWSLSYLLHIRTNNAETKTANCTLWKTPRQYCVSYWHCRQLKIRILDSHESAELPFTKAVLEIVEVLCQARGVGGYRAGGRKAVVSCELIEGWSAVE